VCNCFCWLWGVGFSPGSLPTAQFVRQASSSAGTNPVCSPGDRSCRCLGCVCCHVSTHQMSTLLTPAAQRCIAAMHGSLAAMFPKLPLVCSPCYSSTLSDPEICLLASDCNTSQSRLDFTKTVLVSALLSYLTMNCKLRRLSLQTYDGYMCLEQLGCREQPLSSAMALT
jgi:hypothetical protein